MSIWLQLILSFIATSAFGFIFNVPLKLIPFGGFVGMIGWFVHTIAKDWMDLNNIIAVMSAAFVVTAISQIFARSLKKPILLFNVAGIIPLVPGRIAYNAMRHAVSDEYDAAAQLGTEALLISGAIAIGLVLSEVIYQMIRKITG